MKSFLRSFLYKSEGLQKPKVTDVVSSNAAAFFCSEKISE